MNFSRKSAAYFIRDTSKVIYCVLFMAVTSSVANEPAVSERISKEITDAFHSAPGDRIDNSAEISAALASKETLTLDKFVVTRYNDSHKLELLLTEQARRIREESFSWKTGGVIHKNVGKKVTSELKWNYDGAHRTIDIISFHW